VSLSRRGDPRALDALAAAQAETGRLREAVRTASEAGRVASAAGQSDLARAIEGRRRIYEKGGPFRSPGRDEAARSGS